MEMDLKNIIKLEPNALVKIEPKIKRTVFSKKIGSRVKQMVYNVYSFFKIRKQDQSSIEYLQNTNLHKIVAQATGISMRTVIRIVKEGNEMKHNQGTVVFKSQINTKKNRKKRIVIDDITKDVIKQKATEFYTMYKKVPSLKTLNAALKEEGILNCSPEYLRRLLHTFGFKLKECQPKEKLLIDQQKLMPNVLPSSGIIKDNGTDLLQDVRKPTMTSTKADMQAWLQKHHIEFDVTLRKCDLYTLIIKQHRYENEIK